MRNLINLVFRHQSVWILVGCLLLGGVGGWVLAKVTPATYTSTTQLFIGSPAAGDSAGLYQGDLFSQQRAATYAQLFGGDDLATKVIDDLSLDTTPAELTKQVSATAVDRTVLLDVTVTADSAQGAADIANAYAANFARYVGQLENPEGGSAPNTQVSVVRRAEAPEAPTSPSVGLNVGGGAVLGLVIGGLIVWLRRRFDTTVHDVDNAADLVDAAGLGLLPADPDREVSLLRLPQQASTPYAEALRKLRTTIQFTDPQHPLRRMVIVGADEGDGAHAVAAHLALMFGEVGRRVVLVDADMRTAPLNVYLPATAGDADAARGLSDVLHGTASIEDVVVPLADGRFDLLPAGSATSGPAEDIASPAMSRLIADLHARYAYVILLGAAAAEYTDAAVLAVNTDGVILVARAGSTDDAALTEAGVAVRSAGARLLGVLLTSGLRAKVAKQPRVVQRTPLPAVQNSRPRPSAGTELERRPEADARRAGLENLHRVRQAYSAGDGRFGPVGGASGVASVGATNGAGGLNGADGAGHGAVNGAGVNGSGVNGGGANGVGINGYTGAGHGGGVRWPEADARRDAARDAAGHANGQVDTPASPEPPSRELARLDPMRWSPEDTAARQVPPTPVDDSAMTEPISIQRRPDDIVAGHDGWGPIARDGSGDSGMRWSPSVGGARPGSMRSTNGQAYSDHHDVIDAEVVDVEEEVPTGWRTTHAAPRDGVGAHRVPSGEVPKVTDGSGGPSGTPNPSEAARSAGYPGLDPAGYRGGARPAADEATAAPARGGPGRTAPDRAAPDRAAPDRGTSTGGDDDTVAISSRRGGS